ncbi:CDKN2A-interacting protein isoform X1 [Spea bombifrons]|uniref:CDKN2A-interacting protein isoform X1 n=1 Tax=Spea bombifrons TaxID=233779 RepID=UPI00234B9A0C|nr:CDKN2A-interacting protein isoform X1 [Spea bombifrons]
MASTDDVSDFLRQNREIAAWVETIRGECESDKLWRHRREFILRNINDFCGDGEQPPPVESNHRGLDRLLAYSMVWANHVFTGCRYPQPVMDKILKMAENIKVTDAPIHTTRDELVSKVKKRGITNSHEGVAEPLKKHKLSDVTGASDSSHNKTAQDENQLHCASGYSSWRGSEALGPSTSAGQRTGANPGYDETSGYSQPVSASKAYPAYGSSVPAEAGYESAAPQERNSNATSKGHSQTSVGSGKAQRRLTVDDTKERQSFFNRLYKTVAWKLVSAGGFNANLNHSELLALCIESLKSTLDISFAPLKELADLPQTLTSQENIVCELRCKGVYLGMGCGKTKDNAEAVASREAIKLFLKKKVVVKISKRKYKGREVEDLVLLDEESRPVNLPPALKNPLDLI